MYIKGRVTFLIGLIYQFNNFSEVPLCSTYEKSEKSIAIVQMNKSKFASNCMLINANEIPE